MKRITEGIKFIFLAITSFVGSCYILGVIVDKVVNFIESQGMLGDILSMITFVIFFTILLSGTLINLRKE